MKEMAKLFESGKIGALKLENRIIMAPMGTGSQDPDGCSDFMPGDITIEHSVIHAPLFEKAGADALHVSAGEEETTQF